MTDQLSNDIHWALFQQLQQQQQSQAQQPQPTPQPASAPSVERGPSNDPIRPMSDYLESQLLQLYHNFTSSASHGNLKPSSAIPSMSSSFANNEGLVPRLELQFPATDFPLSQSQVVEKQEHQQMQRLETSQIPPSVLSTTISGVPDSVTTGPASNALGHLMLQSKLEPFQRGHSATSDDEDMWKVFEDEVRHTSSHSDLNVTIQEFLICFGWYAGSSLPRISSFSATALLPTRSSNRNYGKATVVRTHFLRQTQRSSC